MTETESAILAHARRCAPAESCGFVVRTPEGERYFPCVNISGEPEALFPDVAGGLAAGRMQGEIVALVHSPPGGLPWLSEADRRLQVQSDLPWWLVCRGTIHKFRCVPHLTGRRFEHGVTDCYTLFRDAYIWRGLRCRTFIVRMTGGVTARISIWIIWRRRGCIRCRCQRHSRAMCCCAVLVHRCRITPHLLRRRRAAAPYS
ncbi:Mov34/MPN/PAD-1 family protein (plasmid) [Escherichia coli]|nr:Mov34/MPN/PAD-1 family protein [Escherichia coli]UGH76717.1 Mov34/MPN/PAD-1 family protein [Escherichia coli]